jgi:cell division protein FtsB
MAIDIGSAKKERPKSKNNLMMILIFVLIIFFVAYFILAFVFMPQKEAEVKRLTTEVATLNTAAVRANISELNIAKIFINDFRVLLDNSPKTSNFLDTFQRWSHPQITYSNIRIESAPRKVSMSGETSTNRNLMEQIAILNNEDSIESYELSSIVIDEVGKTSFNIVLIIRSSLLR